VHEALRLFSALHPTATDWILSTGIERKVARDDAIAMEGQAFGGLAFVLEGLFSVRLKDAQSAPLVLLGPGELIGEISFLESRPATASVVANEDSRILYIGTAALEEQIRVNPMFAADFYRTLAQMLSRRLRERSLSLAEGFSSRPTDGFTETPACPALMSSMTAFKELLRQADTSARQRDGKVPAALAEEIHGAFNDLKISLARLAQTIANNDVLQEVGRSGCREFIPYLHLTECGRRIHVKPRGYAGDFATIDLIYRNKPGGVPPLGPLVDSLMLEAPVGRAVRNRRGLLAQEIAIALERGGGAARVTSLACGPAAELFDVFHANPMAKLQATLVDIDFQALAFVADARDSLGFGKRMRLEHANLIYLATGRTVLDLTNQDLIYSIGLIDYFDDPFVIALLNWIHGCLAPGGKVILGNFHTCNPDRAFMDMVLDWKLIHRSEGDMHRLFAASKFARACTQIRFEEQGINMFACCIKD
jgi:CRP-like cAMP-binding protein